MCNLGSFILNQKKQPININLKEDFTMKVKVVGTAMIVTSEITAAQMEAAIHYAPDALKVCDKEGNTVYRVSKAEDASVGNFGTIFNGTELETTNLQATVIIPDVEDKKDYVAKNFGLALAALSEAEPIVIEEIEGTMALVGGAVSEMEIQ